MESTIKMVIFHTWWLRCMRNTWAGSFALSPVLWHGECYLCFLSFHFCFCKMRPVHIIVSRCQERDEIRNEARYISLREMLWLLIPCKFIHSHNVFKWRSKLFNWPYFSSFTGHYIFPEPYNPAFSSKITFPFIFHPHLHAILSARDGSPLLLYPNSIHPARHRSLNAST